MRANATVGPPVEILVYENETFEADHYIKLAEEDSYLLTLRRAWGEAINEAFADLPLFEWEKTAAPAWRIAAKEPKG